VTLRGKLYYRKRCLSNRAAKLTGVGRAQGQRGRTLPREWGKKKGPLKANGRIVPPEKKALVPFIFDPRGKPLNRKKGGKTVCRVIGGDKGGEKNNRLEEEGRSFSRGIRGKV